MYTTTWLPQITYGFPLCINKPFWSSNREKWQLQFPATVSALSLPLIRVTRTLYSWESISYHDRVLAISLKHCWIEPAVLLWLLNVGDSDCYLLVLSVTTIIQAVNKRKNIDAARFHTAFEMWKKKRNEKNVHVSCLWTPVERLARKFAHSAGWLSESVESIVEPLRQNTESLCVITSPLMVVKRSLTFERLLIGHVTI